MENKSALECLSQKDKPAGGADQTFNDAKYTSILEKLDILTYSVERNLARIGLTPNEARIYVMLAKKGAQKGSNLAKLLNFPRPQAYYLLASLCKKGIVSRTTNNPMKFVALPFEEAANALLNIQKQELTQLESQTKALLDAWSLITDSEVTCEEIDEEKLQILQGNYAVYRKIHNTISSAQRELIVLANQRELAKLHSNDITDHFESLAARGVHIRLLVFSEPNFKVVEKIENCDIKVLGENNSTTNCIIVDKKQAFFLRDEPHKFGTSAIYTNCSYFVQCVLCLFRATWNSS